MGRRGRLFSIVLRRVGAALSDSVPESDCRLDRDDLDDATGGFNVDCSSVRRDRSRELFPDGGEFDNHGFRAKLTSLPDIDRALEGRATGDGGLVSVGSLAGNEVASEPVVESDKSSADTVNRETAMVGLFLERMEVRRKISLPAATSSFDGESDWVGCVRSENVLRRPG